VMSSIDFAVPGTGISRFVVNIATSANHLRAPGESGRCAPPCRMAVLSPGVNYAAARFPRVIGTTYFLCCAGRQKLAHASISLRRFSSALLRR
jgi:hypothetical protein